jgi:hypothetical protein
MSSVSTLFDAETGRQSKLWAFMSKGTSMAVITASFV